MKRTLAHGMRRAARVLIRWSNKLNPPQVNYNISVNSGIQAGYDHAMVRMQRQTAARMHW